MVIRQHAIAVDQVIPQVCDLEGQAQEIHCGLVAAHPTQRHRRVKKRRAHWRAFLVLAFVAGPGPTGVPRARRIGAGLR
ncbi:hypothetical protein D3C72_2485020 [compost metagenome]